jgi:tRNA 2-thiouridine synthesizing protein A
LEVQATDPGAPADFEAFCETTGHTLEASEEADGVYTLRIRKNG